MKRAAIAIGVVAVLAALAIRFLACRTHVTPPTRAELQDSLRLGNGYLAAQQMPSGNFAYTYDWITRRTLPESNPVRQAGGAWGAALAYQFEPNAETRRVAENALAYCESHEDPKDFLGVTALVALAEIEYARTAEPAARAAHKPHLDRLIETLLDARRPDGLFAPRGNMTEPSPYYDGEALLALAKAARYLGRDDLRPVLAASAFAMRDRHIVAALRDSRDSDDTKGFYQWSSMAFFELSQSGWPELAPLASTIVELGDWVLDEHHVIGKQRNTGYAVEGLVHAYLAATKLGDAAHAAKFHDAIEKILGHLMTWQVGAPRANSFIRDHEPDKAAIGGVQNEESDPVLRIDVALHQMHAIMLTLTAFYPDAAPAAQR
jgi:UDP-N-acetylmuramoyl-tripeptide--D-alanyl-D-alanine ligase